jgi:hypothetical protein
VPWSRYLLGVDSAICAVCFGVNAQASAQTLNWRKFPRLKNGNWFERDLTAYCQIDELRKAGQRMLSAY